MKVENIPSLPFYSIYKVYSKALLTITLTKPNLIKSSHKPLQTSIRLLRMDWISKSKGTKPIQRLESTDELDPSLGKINRFGISTTCYQSRFNFMLNCGKIINRHGMT